MLKVVKFSTNPLKTIIYFTYILKYNNEVQNIKNVIINHHSKYSMWSCNNLRSEVSSLNYSHMISINKGN